MAAALTAFHVWTAAADGTEIPRLALGGRLNLTIPHGDSRTSRARCEIQLDEAGSIIVEAKSLELDVWLQVQEVDGVNGTTLIGGDDDLGAGRNALFAFDGLPNRTYRVTVRSSVEAWGGGVTVEARRGPYVPQDPAARERATTEYWAAAKALAIERDDPVLKARVEWAEILIENNLSTKQRRDRSTATLTGIAARAGENSSVVAFYRKRLANLSRQEGRLDEARLILERSLKVLTDSPGESDPATAEILNDYAWTLDAQGRHNDAEALAQRSLEAYRKTLGAESEGAAIAMNSLGVLLQIAGRLERARPLVEQALAINTKLFGGDSVSVGANLNNLGLIARDSGDLPRALELFERAIGISEAAPMKSNSEVIIQLENLAELHSKLGNEAKAVDVCRRIVTLAENEFGAESRKVGAELNRLALHLSAAHDIPAAQLAIERALAIWSNLGEPEDSEVAISEWDAGQFALQVKDDAGARRHLERALAIKTKLHGPESTELLDVLGSLGIAHWRAGDIEGARALYERALRIADGPTGTDAAQVAQSLENLASLARMQGRPDDARSLLTSAVAKYESAADQLTPASSKNAKEIADRLEAASQTLNDDFGDPNGAVDVMKRVVAIRERSLPEVDDALIGSLEQLAALTTASGDVKSGAAIADRALKLAEGAWEANDAKTIQALAVSAFCGDAAGQRVKSRRQSARVREFVNLVTTPERSWSSQRLEELASRLAGYDRRSLKTLYERIAAIHEAEGADAATRASDEERRAGLEMFSGGLDVAERRFQRALELRRQSPVSGATSTAPILNNLAVLRSVYGDDEGARKLLEEALGTDSLDSPMPPTVRQQVLYNLGVALRSLGQFPEARETLGRYLRGEEHEHGSHSAQFAWATLGVALTLSDEHEDGAAVLEFGRALAIFQRLGSSNELGAQIALAGRAETQRKLGRVVDAESDEHVLLTEYKSQRGWTYAWIGGTLGAQPLTWTSIVSFTDMTRVWRVVMSPAGLRQSLGVTEGFDRSMGANTPLGVEALVLLATAEWRSGRYGQAIETATKASRRLDDRTRALISVLPERQALRLARSQRHPESVFFSTLVENRGPQSDALNAAWSWTLRHRALVLDELAQRHRVALSDESSDVHESRARLLDARRRLSFLFLQYPVGAPNPEAVAVLEDAQKQRDDADAALAAASASYRASQRVRDASPREVASALQPDSALVEICRVPVLGKDPAATPERYVALILLGKLGKADFVDLGPAAEIDALIAALQEDLRASFESGFDQTTMSLEAFRAPGSEVRQRIWDPIARKLGGAKLVFVVPDGALSQVNLSALPTAGGRFVFDDGIDVHLLSTGRDLVRLSDSSSGERQGRGVLALGAPDYDANHVESSAGSPDGTAEPMYRGPRPGCKSVASLRWPPLPGSGEEARAVANLVADVEPGEVLLSAAAGEDRLKRDAPGKRFLHLATHAFFLRPDCELSGPAAGETPGVSRAPVLSTDNPLLLSGLILAGANRADVAPADTEDGFLTAEEIASMDLRGTELATLSACETGLGAVEAGDGVYGLRRALEIAGVQTVLMSLWPVPDRETPLWMEAFYRARMRGASIVDAQREASGDALERLRAAGRAPHPYYWASFQAAGDWRSRSGASRSAAE